MTALASSGLVEQELGGHRSRIKIFTFQDAFFVPRVLPETPAITGRAGGSEEEIKSEIGKRIFEHERASQGMRRRFSLPPFTLANSRRSDFSFPLLIRFFFLYWFHTVNILLSSFPLFSYFFIATLWGHDFRATSITRDPRQDDTKLCCGGPSGTARCRKNRRGRAKVHASTRQGE